MSATPAAARARRYLLGDLTDDECAVVEQDYLVDEESVDVIAAAEDDLIEQYLSGDLDAGERNRFERHYLAAPHRRLRVDAVRRLIAEASPAGAGSSLRAGRGSAAAPPSIATKGWFSTRGQQWLAAAALVVIAAASTLWVFTPSSARRTDVGETRVAPPSSSAPQTAAPAPVQPTIFALSLPPVMVRSGSDQPGVVIPAGTTVLAIQLERDLDDRKLAARRVSIRTVAGRDVWQGPVVPVAQASPAITARVDVPMDSLLADDYLVTLYGTDPAGTEREWSQYFLRVRRP